MRFYPLVFNGKEIHNRMQAYWEQGSEDGIAAYYNYTADGTRNFKLTSPRISMSQNAFTFNTVQSVPPLVYPTLYASPLITLTKHGYTKHYFEGMNRICSKLGGGFDAGLLVEIEDTVPTVACDYVQQSKRQNEGVNRTFADCLGMGAEVDGKYDLYKVVIREIERDEKEPAFYYHSDLCGSREQSQACLSYAEMQQSVRSNHLGSAAYLTNDDGKVIQTLNYLPYGEDWVERNRFDPADTTRLGIYRFNGKEKDHESGFHYYGARYYWSELLTGWLSVDPMLDKYPNVSLYNYCHWNPIILIDPSGESDRKFVDYATGEYLGEIDDGVNETVRITQEDYAMLQKRRTYDENRGDEEYTQYNKMIDVYSIGKEGYDIAQTAKKYVGSTAWAYNTPKDSFGKNTHKCNQFVDDVLKECGIVIPGAWPPIARKWADRNNSIEGFSVVTGEPHLGDIIAACKSSWRDASGHVAIVTGIDLDTGRIRTTSAGKEKVTENSFGESIRHTLKWSNIKFDFFAIKRPN